MKNVIIILFSILLIGCGIQSESENQLKSYTGIYAVNGKLYINGYGEPEGKPIINYKKHEDWKHMKPSFSRTGQRVVFFERIKGFNKKWPAWKNKICVMNSDGTGLKILTSGEYGDFNSTWMRDGTKRIIFIRYFKEKDRWGTFITHPNAAPGDEKLITDPQKAEVGLSSLKNGLIIILRKDINNKDINLYAITYNEKKNNTIYHKINISPPINPKHYISRFTVSPDEKKIAFSLDQDLDIMTRKDNVICIADFDAESLRITNPKIISSKNKNNNYVDDYAAWTLDRKKIIYHSNRNGTYQLYLYDIKTGRTKRVSKNPKLHYMFPCSVNAPK